MPTDRRGEDPFPAASDGPAGEGRRPGVRELDVLVACANEDARIIVATVLRHAGWRVREVPDPTQALDAALDACPLLVVVSYPTPAGAGCTVTERLRTHPRTAALPILNVTGRAFAAELAAAEAAGVTASLVMPVTAAEVVEEVRRLIGPAGVTQRERRAGQRMPDGPSDAHDAARLHGSPGT